MRGEKMIGGCVDFDTLIHNIIGLNIIVVFKYYTQ